VYFFVCSKPHPKHDEKSHAINKNYHQLNLFTWNFLPPIMDLVELSTQAFHPPKNAIQSPIHAMHSGKRTHLMNMFLKLTAAATLITLATPNAHSIAASFMYAPKVEQTGTGLMNSGLLMSHSQTAWGLNYNYPFK
jgi:hypothetical protein